MRPFYLLLPVFAFCLSAQAQTPFWTESFGTGCNQGQLAASYTGTNGSWTVTDATAGNNAANKWYVSSTEANTGAGNCGNGCIANGSLTNATLHVAGQYVEYMSFPIVDADPGAAYNVGGIQGFGFQSATDIRAESPVINCSGQSNVVLSFIYMEGGQSTLDNATLRADYGAGWVMVADLAKTTTGCAPQGTWTAYSVALPNADGQSNVRIGFHWVNDDDGAGADPSFAVDDIQMSSDVTTGITALTNTENMQITTQGNTVEVAFRDVDEEILVVRGYDILGQQLLSKAGRGSSHEQVNVSGLKGILVLQVETRSGIHTRKVVLR